MDTAAAEAACSSSSSRSTASGRSRSIGATMGSPAGSLLPCLETYVGSSSRASARSST
jgi:hypothetical protein